MKRIADCKIISMTKKTLIHQTAKEFFITIGAGLAILVTIMWLLTMGFNSCSSKAPIATTSNNIRHSILLVSQDGTVQEEIACLNADEEAPAGTHQVKIPSIVLRALNSASDSISLENKFLMAICEQLERPNYERNNNTSNH